MTANEATAPDLVIRRTMPVSRERIFNAWLDPEKLARFMLPGDVRRASAEVDARVGGRFRIVMEHGRGDAEHSGEYLEIDPPSRLSFTWISGSTDGRATTVTIELSARSDGGSDLVLTHRGLPSRTYDAHSGGWGRILERLDAVMAPAPP